MGDQNGSLTKSTISGINGIVYLVIGSMLLWIGATVTDLGKKMERFEALAESQNELQATRERVAKLEREQVRAEAASSLSEMAARLGGVEASIRQIWPRLRANNENIEKLKQAIVSGHPDFKIELTKPEAY